MRNNGFGIEIIVDGRALPEIQHEGKTYFACELGKEFALRLIVPRNSRYEAVCSVDGLDVRTAKIATRDARGYVVTHATNPDANLIKGFRLNDAEEAGFYFIGKGGSYAKLTDRPTNVGVIGAAFFSEYEHIIFESCLSFGPRDRGDTFGATTKGGGLEHSAGTGFGRRIENKVGSTSFRRDQQVAQFVLEYDFREQLVKAGIIKSAPLGEVDPFPGDAKPRPITGCRPPVGWKG
jgi:hypothetical protein